MEDNFVWINYRINVFLRTAGENLTEELSKLHFIFPEKQFVRNFLLEKIFIFMKSLRSSVENFLAGLWKLHSIFSEEYCGRFFFEKNLYISNFLRAWVENFLAALSKLISTVPEELFWKSFCFEKSIGS